MQATHLEMIKLITPITNHDDDDDHGDNNNDNQPAKPLTTQTTTTTTTTRPTILDARVDDKEAQIDLLRPLDEIETAADQNCGATGAVLATADSDSLSSSSSSSPPSSSSSGSGSSSSTAAADVKNSIQHQNQRNPAPGAAAKVTVGQEPDRASPVVSLSVVKSQQQQQLLRELEREQQQQQQQQTKHGNQTNESDHRKGGPVIMDPLGSQDGTSSVGAMSSLRPNDYLDKGEKDIILVAELKFRATGKNSEEERSASEDFRSETTSSPINISNSMSSESAASNISLTSGEDNDDSETMTGSELAASTTGSITTASGPHPAGLWSPSTTLLTDDQPAASSYEADTLRIIQSLHEQRRELHDIDRQLSGLISSHLSSIGRSDWYAAPISSASQQIATDCGFDNQVIDLTTTAGGKLNYDGERKQQIMNFASVSINEYGEDEEDKRATKRALSTQTPESHLISTSSSSRSVVGGNLGQFSSINLRKSRLLSATIAADYSTRPIGQSLLLNNHQELPQNHHHHCPDEHLRVPAVGFVADNEQQQQQQRRRRGYDDDDDDNDDETKILPKRALITTTTTTAPELAALDCSSELTHDIQKLKRLKLSGHLAISSSGSNHYNVADSAYSAPTNNCSTTNNQSAGQSTTTTTTTTAAAAAGATTKTKTVATTPTETSNVDLLRDFMLHNQYLPSHLVLECLSQCQKQTSTPSSSSLSSILLPSAMCLIDASSTSSATTKTASSSARNQTSEIGGSGHNFMDCHHQQQQQINHLDMIASNHHHHHHHHNHHNHNHHQNLHQRGSIEFNTSYYTQQASASASAVLDQSADLQQQQQPDHQQAARSRAFVSATSHLNQNQLQSVSHHPNNNSNNNRNSRTPAGDDNYCLALPMTRRQAASAQLQHTSQETLDLIRATMSKGYHNHHQQQQHQLQQLQLQQQQQQQQQHHHHHHLISMADIQQRVAFKCHVCGSGFEDRHRLQQHLSIHLNLQPSWFEEKTITETMAQYESKRGDYLCAVCDIRFETTAEFDKHMQAHGDKPHRCDLCSQDNKLVSFRYYRQLLTHLRSHCFLYSCRYVPDCKQTSNRKDYLKLHILKHHLNNQLPKQYTICCH